MKNLFDEIEFEGRKYWTSLVKWGFIRKKGYQLIKSNNIFENPSFTPECEVAVFTKKPSNGRSPVVVIYISDDTNGEILFNKVAKEISVSGLQGVMSYVSNIKISHGKEFGKIYPENF